MVGNFYFGRVIGINWERIERKWKGDEMMHSGVASPGRGFAASLVSNGDIMRDLWRRQNGKA